MLITKCRNKKGVRMCQNIDEGIGNGHDEVCRRGAEVYAEALRTGGFSGEAPACLLKLGLLRRRQEERGVGFLAPVPPDIALLELARPIERAIVERQHLLAALRVSVSRLESIYREVLRQEAEPVRRLAGERALSLALEEGLSSCRTEVLTVRPGGGRAQEQLAEELPRDLGISARGVRQRTLYQHAVRSHGPTLACIERVVAAGAEVRTVDELPESLIVCDRSVAYLLSGRDRQVTALVIQHPDLVRYIAKSFDQVWSRADPVHVEAGRMGPDLRTDETRSTILRMLVQGCTDQAIAGRLGISVRTVGTHVKRASEALNSRSRVQLGYLLAQLDHVERQGANRRTVGSSGAAGRSSLPG